MSCESLLINEMTGFTIAEFEHLLTSISVFFLTMSSSNTPACKLYEDKQNKNNSFCTN